LINTNAIGKEKIHTINLLVKQYEADCLLGCETQCDQIFADKGGPFADLFGVGEKKRSVARWNKNEKCAREQHCGTAMMVIEQTQQISEDGAGY